MLDYAGRMNDFFLWAQKKNIRCFSCDSRQVAEGSLFFALSGARVQGTSFLEEVASRGAIAAVVPQGYQGESFGLELVRVDDVLLALQELAKRKVQSASPFIIGVTGTVGKTTTKEFLFTLLREKFSVAKNQGSLNSQVGLPLTLLNWSGEEVILVLEMGMNHAGELTRLIDIAPPTLGVFTKLTLVHSEFFDSLEAIGRAKCELFASSKLERGFFAKELLEWECVRELPLSKETFCLEDLKGFTLPFAESHLLENVAGAVCVARYLGLSDEEIARGVGKLKPFTHRFEKVKKRGILFVDDSYNASPAAVKGALSNLPKGKRVIGCLAAMKELGKFEAESHREVAEHALPLLDHLICIGKETRPMVEVFEKRGKAVSYFGTKEEALTKLKEVAEEGDVVLIKGSKSFELWTLLEDF